jgi:hypothetical protein
MERLRFNRDHQARNLMEPFIAVAAVFLTVFALWALHRLGGWVGLHFFDAHTHSAKDHASALFCGVLVAIFVGPPLYGLFYACYAILTSVIAYFGGHESWAT